MSAPIFVVVTCLMLSAIVSAAIWKGLIASPTSNPSERSLHNAPVARGGGLAIALAVLFGWTALGIPTTALLAVALLWGISALDDWGPVSPVLRLLVQAVVATIVSDADDYAKDAVAQLEAAGVRVEADLRNEKINYKLREHSLQKVPYLLVVGKREAEEGTVAIRTLGQDGQRIMPLAEAVAMLKGEATPPDLKD